MRFFLPELLTRFFAAVIAISFGGKCRRAIPPGRRRLSAKCRTAGAIEGVEFLRGVRGGQRRKCNLGLDEFCLAILCQSHVPLAQLALWLDGERPSERLIDA